MKGYNSRREAVNRSVTISPKMNEEIFLNVQLGSSIGTQYDFTKMTNAELLRAAQTLGREGKISTKSEAELIGIASGVDNASPNDRGVNVGEALADPKQKDFLAYLQQTYQSQTSQAGSKGSELYQVALNELSKYQTTSRVEVDKTVSTLA